MAKSNSLDDETDSPVRVSIPVRLRITADALRGDPDHVDAALAKTIGRAVAASRQHVVEPRGGGDVVRPNRPQFAWSGAGLAQLAPGDREAAEARVTRVIAQALARNDLPTWHDGDQVVRIAPGGGDDDDGDDVAAAPAADANAVVFDWFEFPDDDWGLFVEVFRDALQREHGSVPKSGYIGALKRGAGPDPDSIEIDIYIFDLAKCDFGEDADASKVEPVVTWSGYVSQSEFDPKTKTFTRKKMRLPARGPYVLRGFTPTGTDDERKAYITRVEAADIRSRIVDDTDLSKHVEQNLKAAIDVRVKTGFPPGTVATFEIDTPFGGVMSLNAQAASDDKLPWPITAYALASPQRRHASSAKDGQGSGSSDGKSQGETGKSEQGDGEDAQGQQADGSYIVNPNATGTGKATFAYPPGTGALDLVCEPFEDEPPVEQWANAKAIEHLMRVIRDRLQMPECKYPGTFCINAATVIGGHSTAIARAAVADDAFTGELEPKADGFLVEPVPTMAIQYLRLLCGTVPYLTALQDLFFEERGAAWQLHFRESYAPALRESLGWVFVFACQIAFLQQLRYSRQQIDQRVDRFDSGYADFFEETVLQLLTDTATLGLLRERLVGFLASRLDSSDAVARAAVDTWRSARRGGELLDEQLQDLADAPGETVVEPKSWDDSQSGVLGLLVPRTNAAQLVTKPKIAKKGDDWAIRDDDDRLWTLKELDMAIALQQNTAESVDPLVKQILDLDGIVPMFKANPWMIKLHLKRLLAEMQDDNDEITGKVTGSAMWAFEKGPISEDLEHASVPYFKYVLGGIHLNAHALIYDAFEGDAEYAFALNDLFDAQAGWRDIKSFFINGLIIVLSVLCPPAGAILGIAQAVSQEADASEMKDVYRSLIDPDVVISKAELEIEQFMAELMLALSIIPEAGNIMKTASGLAESALKGTIKTFAKDALEAILKDAIKALEKNLVAAFAAEIVKFEVFGGAMQALLSPLAAAIEEEVSAGPLGIDPQALGLQTADDVLDDREYTLDELPVYDEADDVDPDEGD